MTETTKVRLGNWISKTAKAHLTNKAKEKNLPEAALLEIQILKIK
jgi:hypothetical protein